MAANGRGSPCRGTSPERHDAHNMTKGRRGGPSLVSGFCSVLADVQADILVDAAAVEQEEQVLVALLLRLLQLLRRVGGSAAGLLVDRGDPGAGPQAPRGPRANPGGLVDGRG